MRIFSAVVALAVAGRADQPGAPRPPAPLWVRYGIPLWAAAGCVYKVTPAVVERVKKSGWAETTLRAAEEWWRGRTAGGPVARLSGEAHAATTGYATADDATAPHGLGNNSTGNVTAGNATAPHGSGNNSTGNVSTVGQRANGLDLEALLNASWAERRMPGFRQALRAHISAHNLDGSRPTPRPAGTPTTGQPAGQPTTCPTGGGPTDSDAATGQADGQPTTCPTGGGGPTDGDAPTGLADGGDPVAGDAGDCPPDSPLRVDYNPTWSAPRGSVCVPHPAHVSAVKEGIRRHLGIPVDQQVVFLGRPLEDHWALVYDDNWDPGVVVHVGMRPRGGELDEDDDDWNQRAACRWDWHECRGDLMVLRDGRDSGQPIDAMVTFLATFGGKGEAKAAAVDFVDTLFSEDGWAVRFLNFLAEVPRLLSLGYMQTGNLVTAACEEKRDVLRGGELTQDNRDLVAICTTLTDLGLVAFDDVTHNLVDGHRIVEARQMLVDLGYSLDSEAVRALTVESVGVLFFNLGMSEPYLRMLTGKLVWAHCWWGTYSMHVLKLFQPNTFDQWWAAGIGRVADLAATARGNDAEDAERAKAEFRAVVRGCSDTYPAQLGTAYERNLRETGLHVERREQTRMFNTIRTSGVDWDLYAVPMGKTLAWDETKPGPQGILHVKLPAAEPLSTDGLHRLDNVDALLRPFSKLTLAAANAARTGELGKPLSPDLEEVGPGSQLASYVYTTHGSRSSNLLGSAQVAYLAFSADGRVEMVMRPGVTGFDTNPFVDAARRAGCEIGDGDGEHVKTALMVCFAEGWVSVSDVDAERCVVEFVRLARDWQDDNQQLRDQRLTDEAEREARMPALTEAGIANGGPLRAATVVMIGDGVPEGQRGYGMAGAMPFGDHGCVDERGVPLWTDRDSLEEYLRKQGADVVVFSRGGRAAFMERFGSRDDGRALTNMNIVHDKALMIVSNRYRRPGQPHELVRPFVSQERAFSEDYVCAVAENGGVFVFARDGRRAGSEEYLLYEWGEVPANGGQRPRLVRPRGPNGLGDRNPATRALGAVPAAAERRRGGRRAAASQPPPPPDDALVTPAAARNTPLPEREPYDFREIPPAGQDVARMRWLRARWQIEFPTDRLGRTPLGWDSRDDYLIACLDQRRVDPVQSIRPRM